MRSVFIDTWGWVTLFNRKERHHQKVNQLYQHHRHTESTIVTTDYILDEVYTLLFRRVPFEFAQHALNTLSDAIEQGYITVIWMTPECFETAQNLRQQLSR